MVAALDDILVDEKVVLMAGASAGLTVFEADN